MLCTFILTVLAWQYGMQSISQGCNRHADADRKFKRSFGAAPSEAPPPAATPRAAPRALDRHRRMGRGGPLGLPQGEGLGQAVYGRLGGRLKDGLSTTHPLRGDELRAIKAWLAIRTYGRLADLPV